MRVPTTFLLPALFGLGVAVIGLVLVSFRPEVSSTCYANPPIGNQRMKTGRNRTAGNNRSSLQGNAPNGYQRMDVGGNATTKNNPNNLPENAPQFSVNIFANAVPIAPSTFFVESLISSFQQCLDSRPLEQLNVTIYLDPHPKSSAAEEFRRRLSEFGNVVLTNGLLDGYKKSLYNVKTEYTFQLEHDWQFLCQNINHSATQIVSAMKALKLDYLNFGKQSNVPKPFRRNGERNPWPNRQVIPYGMWGNLSICRNMGRTNNPHIIHVPTYRYYAQKYLPKSARGAQGLERVLTKALGFGFIYGPLGHPPTIGHLNGRCQRSKFEHSLFHAKAEC